MNATYEILGGILVVMGAVQLWLRWGPWAKEQQENEKALAKRRAEAVAQEEDGGAAVDGRPPPGPKSKGGPVVMDRGSKLWNKWTAALGPLGIAFGLVLIIWGVVGG